MPRVSQARTKTQSQDDQTSLIGQFGAFPTRIVLDRACTPATLRVYLLLCGAGCWSGWHPIPLDMLATALDLTTRYVRELVRWLIRAGYLLRRYSPDRGVWWLRAADFRQPNPHGEESVGPHD